MVNIVSMATEKNSITRTKLLFDTSLNFVRLGTRELVKLFFVAMVMVFTIAMVIEMVPATKRYCLNRSLQLILPLSNFRLNELLSFSLLLWK